MRPSFCASTVMEWLAGAPALRIVLSHFHMLWMKKLHEIDVSRCCGYMRRTLTTAQYI